MMQLKNKVVISAAGSGKTTYIVGDALKLCDRKILILTYTIDNLNEIKKKVIEEAGVIPKNIKIQSWYSFLLNEGVRPYQNYMYDEERIQSIKFVNGISTRFEKKEDIKKYYLQSGKYIYTDKISLFVDECNKKSNGAIIKRLESIYDHIYIDEVQDLAGYDFDILKLLFQSKINTTLVGDNRQATFATNSSPKYKKYKGKNIHDLFLDWQKAKLCTISYRTECFRCNQDICDLADSLYPTMDKTTSRNNNLTGHDGVFIIKEKDMAKYIEEFNPQLLRFDVRTNVNADSVLNFGMSKGRTFDRVLIYPNGKMKSFLKTGDYSHLEASKAKYYVAFTRAKHSVAVVYDGVCKLDECIPYDNTKEIK